MTKAQYVFCGLCLMLYARFAFYLFYVNCFNRLHRGNTEKAFLHVVEEHRKD